MTFILLISLPLQSFNALAGQGVLDIVSQNLHRFYDDKDDGYHEKVVSRKSYQHRLQQLGDKIDREYQFPDVIALQEVENKSILQDLSKLLETKYHKRYTAVLIEGNDMSGLDVGFMVKQSYRIKSVTSLFSNITINKNGGKLFSRPPLLVELCQIECFTVVNLHLRSMKGLRSPRNQQYIVLKRRLQVENLAKWIDKYQQNQPQQHLIIIGDFNALTPSDVYVDSVGTLIGKPDQQRPKWKSPDLIKQDLTDATLRVPAKDRYSYIYKGKKQLLDYLLVSANLKSKIQSLTFTRIDYHFSDHAGVKARFIFN